MDTLKEHTGMDRPDLSPREVEVLRGVAADKTYAEIAFDLGLSHETVKSYANRLRAKLGVNTKTGLAVWWLRNRRKLGEGTCG